MRPIRTLLNELGIKPHTLTYYERALTHPTFAHEQSLDSYQRLEFLGDALLDKCVSEFIFRHYVDFDEGQMSELRASVVDGVTLAKIAESLNLQDYLRVGNNSENLREKAKVLEDVFEALLAAIYLDQGEAVLERFLARTLFDYITRQAQTGTRPAKTQLQELLQTRSNAKISYRSEKTETGFHVRVYQGSELIGEGAGATKKAAEISAANDALAKVARPRRNKAWS